MSINATLRRLNEAKLIFNSRTPMGLNVVIYKDEAGYFGLIMNQGEVGEEFFPEESEVEYILKNLEYPPGHPSCARWVIQQVWHILDRAPTTKIDSSKIKIEPNEYSF